MAQLARRQLPQLLLGLWLYGATMALLVRAGLGLDPWDVFHQGLTRHLPLSFGEVTAVVGIVVLVAWIPLRQRPGIGTVLNIIVIAVSVDVTLWMVPQPPSAAMGIRLALLALGVVGNGLAGALYVGANLGSGPRDGVWLALVRLTGRSVREVRTALELTVLSIGFALGGTVNFGTVVYALAIGHVVQFFLPRVRVLEAKEASGHAISERLTAPITAPAEPPAIVWPDWPRPSLEDRRLRHPVTGGHRMPRGPRAWPSLRGGRLRVPRRAVRRAPAGAAPARRSPAA